MLPLRPRLEGRPYALGYKAQADQSRSVAASSVRPEANSPTVSDRFSDMPRQGEAGPGQDQLNLCRNRAFDRDRVKTRAVRMSVEECSAAGFPGSHSKLARVDFGPFTEHCSTRFR